MKRAKAIIVLVTAVTFALSISIEIFAAEDRAYLNATVYVKPISATPLGGGTALMVSVSPLIIDLGNADTGGVTDTKQFNVSCETNCNHRWELTLELVSSLTSGIFAVPNTELYWGGSQTGYGEFIGGHLDTFPTIIYTASPGQYITTSPVVFNLRLYASIPSNQAAGSYDTSLLVRMRDTVTNEQEVASVNITLNVNSTFTMSVSPTSIEFGKVEPGQATEAKGVYVTCSTNNNTPWNVSIHAVSELASGIDVIPLENFRWSFQDTGYGRSMTTTPFEVYKSKIDEYITSSPVNLYLSFDVNVPKNQPGGQYNSTLVVTMTEEGEL